VYLSPANSVRRTCRKATSRPGGGHRLEILVAKELPVRDHLKVASALSIVGAGEQRVPRESVIRQVTDHLHGLVP